MIARRICSPGVFSLGILAVLALGCTGNPNARNTPEEEARYREMRNKMVKSQLVKRGIKDKRVLDAVLNVPRHHFVPLELQDRAYEDGALPIGEGQTISQPYVVGIMSEYLQVLPGDRVLEIGTGSGYQAAVLAELGVRVYSIEIVESLANSAAKVLRKLGYQDVSVRFGDGYEGWPEEAPFDAIIVTAAPDHIPQPLVDQLKIGGRMVIPVGGRGNQDLKLLIKEVAGVREEDIIPVRFVPMTGEAQVR